VSRRAALPGFGLALGITLSYLAVMVVMPVTALVFRSGGLGWEQFLATVADPRALAAYRLSIGTSLAAATFNVLFGALVAWVLVRYRFPGRRLVDALIDLPFALPTAVAGIALTSLYAPNGWIGRWLSPLGIEVAYTRLGIVVALTFIGLPFVVRTVQPVLQDLEREIEDAAVTLGAGRWQTVRRVLVPAATPALLTGFTLALARALGEYGSVVFIAGNMPLRTEVVPLLIMSRLEQFDYAGAAAVAVVMLALSFVLLLGVTVLQWAGRRRYAG
jgi:sulfate transport system permease protein